LLIFSQLYCCPVLLSIQKIMANPHFTFGLVKKILMRASKSRNIPYLNKKTIYGELLWQ
jgi:hypothetical protein